MHPLLLWCNVDLYMFGLREVFTKAVELGSLLWSLPLSLTLSCQEVGSSRDGLDDVFNTITLHTLHDGGKCAFASIDRNLHYIFLKPFTGLLTVEMSHLSFRGFNLDLEESISFDCLSAISCSRCREY